MDCAQSDLFYTKERLGIEILIIFWLFIQLTPLCHILQFFFFVLIPNYLLLCLTMTMAKIKIEFDAYMPLHA